jgi:hypothetical protein
MTPIRQLPPDYREVKHLVVTEAGKILWLNILALLPMAAAFFLMAGWLSVVLRLLGSWESSMGSRVPIWLALAALLLLMIPLHEGAHGLAIVWVGHKPRFGAKLSRLVVYATTDAGLFRRNEFVLVALAPLVALTLLGMLLVFFVPDWARYYVSLGVILNAGSAIGDLWMLLVVLRYPASAIVRDEEDGIRIYMQKVV